MAIFIATVSGSIDATATRQKAVLQSAMKAAYSLFSDATDESNLEVRYYVPGPTLVVDWSGIRASSYVKRDHTLLVQVAVPADVDADSMMDFISDTLAESVEVATATTDRRGLPLDMSSLRQEMRSLVSTLE